MRCAAVLFGAAAILAGCSTPAAEVAGFRSPAMDPKSPVYQDVMYAARHPGPYPRFADIPKAPTDIRPISAWATAVASIESDKAHLDSVVASLPPPPTDTEAFAANARDQVKAPGLEAPTPETADQTQAYAQSLRARATPPPKRKGHQP